MIKPIHHLLIANRGEIAHRIIRTVRNMGIRTTAVFSDADADLPYVAAADSAVRLPGVAPADTYLNGGLLIAIAKEQGADAIHPGYGFLSESAAFAKKVREADLIFVGPHTEAIAQMGSKSEAKKLMQKHGVPVIPGYDGPNQDLENLEKEGRKLGFPLLIKAVAGGGGKGMRIVESGDDLVTQLEAAQREAKAAFGNEEVLLERYFTSIRHIEFQIFGDQHGQALHLYERECTIQRRYQKIMEESPSPILSDDDRTKMAEAALTATRALNYDNAGTVEFMYVGPGEFYFLEVNTRLQVEHGVTEAITGLDLVEWQIMAAEGRPLPLKQEDIHPQGYALQFRLYAEDADQHFMPSGGPVHLWDQPKLPGVRFDTSVQTGNSISNHYDPMIAKVIAHGPDRPAAWRKMNYALQQLACLGLTTNKPLLLGLLHNEQVLRGDYDTQFLKSHAKNEWLIKANDWDHKLARLSCLVYDWHQRRQQATLLSHISGGWRNNFYQEQQVTYRIEEVLTPLHYRQQDGQLIIWDHDRKHTVTNVSSHGSRLSFQLDGQRVRVEVVTSDDHCWLGLPNGLDLKVNRTPRFPTPESTSPDNQYTAPMPGQIVAVHIVPGQIIEEGDPLVVLSSMKMEHTIHALGPGTVEAVVVTTGDQVEKDAPLFYLEKTDADHAVY